MANIIIVPLYKTDLNSFEHISLEQCFKLLGKHHIIAIKPYHLDITSLQTLYPFNEVVSFDDHYFKNINGYNTLMLSNIFYERFLSHQYMLIYQTDAFVFKDDFEKWCSAGFDYIGAPWLRLLKNNTALNKKMVTLKSYFYTRFNIKQNGLPKTKQLYNKVGNGGFSLRNIQKFHELSIINREIAAHYIALNNPAFNEDLFWSIEVNRAKRNLHIPNYKTAVNFSIETFPEEAFKLTNNQLPFGCHAWEKELPFWKNKIVKFGYEL